MAILDLFMNYVVPVVAGVFVLIFVSIFLYIIHKAVMKPLGVYRGIKNRMIAMRKKKLLKDEKLIEYCVARVEKDWKEPQVREELLLANKYPKSRIDEIIFVYNTIYKEMRGTPGKKPAQDLP
jgi:hypothetical protein